MFGLTTKFNKMQEATIKHETPAIGNVLLADSARYILFLIDSKIKQHDGIIFCSYKEAREYAAVCIKEGWYCDKAVIGMFSMDTQAKEMRISMVETIGFKGDKKNVNQLDLFH
jgi:hypothetical protein